MEESMKIRMNDSKILPGNLLPPKTDWSHHLHKENLGFIANNATSTPTVARQFLNLRISNQITYELLFHFHLSYRKF